MRICRLTRVRRSRSLVDSGYASSCETKRAPGRRGCPNGARERRSVRRSTLGPGRAASTTAGCGVGTPRRQYRFRNGGKLASSGCIRQSRSASRSIPRAWKSRTGNGGPGTGIPSPNQECVTSRGRRERQMKRLCPPMEELPHNAGHSAGIRSTSDTDHFHERPEEKSARTSMHRHAFAGAGHPEDRERHTSPRSCTSRICDRARTPECGRVTPDRRLCREHQDGSSVHARAARRNCAPTAASGHRRPGAAP